MRLRSFAPLLLAAACTTPVYVAHYDLQLSSVTRAERGAELARFDDVRGHTFQDDLIKAVWNPFEKQLGLILTNKTDRVERIVWNQVRYIDASGKSDRVVHEGASDPNAPMPPTAVEPHKTLLELIEPAGHIGAQLNRQDLPLIAYASGTSEREVRSKMTRGTITVLLPIEADGVIREYAFRFSVTGTVVRSGWAS